MTKEMNQSVSDRRLPKRINQKNWVQFANLYSKHTTKGVLISDLVGVELMYAFTSTHVFVFWENGGIVDLVDYADLSRIPDLWDYVATVSSRMFESLATDAYRTAISMKASRNK